MAFSQKSLPPKTQIFMPSFGESRILHSRTRIWASTSHLLTGVAASGKKIEMRNTSIKRIANGRLAESWGTLDTLSAMRQLGLIPAR